MFKDYSKNNFLFKKLIYLILLDFASLFYLRVLINFCKMFLKNFCIIFFKNKK